MPWKTACAQREVVSKHAPPPQHCLWCSKSVQLMLALSVDSCKVGNTTWFQDSRSWLHSRTDLHSVRLCLTAGGDSCGAFLFPLTKLRRLAWGPWACPTNGLLGGCLISSERVEGAWTRFLPNVKSYLLSDTHSSLEIFAHSSNEDARKSAVFCWPQVHRLY